MRKFIFAVGLLACLSGRAMAAEGNFEIGYSSFATAGIRCSTSTAIRINATRPTGFTAEITGYRIMNQDSADAVWIGGISVSTDTAAAATITNLGEYLPAGSSAPWAINKDYRSAGALVPIYCKAADAAGAAGAIISVVWFGY